MAVSQNVPTNVLTDALVKREKKQGGWRARHTGCPARRGPARRTGPAGARGA
ncbi:hypothetical protein ACLGIH_04965 [Streptomyces sp. HMX87]|uniref:hypothetical protein n=1 Tax=Streptomyces sp. HMX87 TaxID=3390849 RepID=UPI003A838B66